jgi:Transposase DDE domain group 1
MHVLSSFVPVQPVRRSGALALRAGNVHSADGWEDVLKPVVIRYKGKVSRLYFRADAAFANPDLYEYLEGEGIKYAIRLPANPTAGKDRPSADPPCGAAAQ